MADGLEQPLLLPQHMATLRILKKHEVFLTLKRGLAMVSCCCCFFIYFYFFLSIHAILALREFILTSLFSFLKAIQTTHIVEEWVDNALRQMKEEEGRHIATIKAFTVAKQRIKDLNVKLTKENKNKKNAKAALVGVEWQAEDQHQLLHKVEHKLTITKEQIGALMKKLEKAEKATAQVEQEGDDTGWRRLRKTSGFRSVEPIEAMPPDVERCTEPSWDGCFFNTKEGRKCLLPHSHLCGKPF